MGVPAWEDAKRPEWEQRRMEVYAAMVDSMDQNIGLIIARLKDMDYYNNTLIMFCADNGGCAEEYGSNRDAEPDSQVRSTGWVECEGHEA